MHKSMTQSERCKFYCQNCHWMPKDIPMCVNCKHFWQHYICKGGPNDTAQWVVPLHCGHCIYPRVKDRKVYDVCEHFKQK